MTGKAEIEPVHQYNPRRAFYRSIRWIVHRSRLNQLGCAPEARSAAGEFFGFERTCQISTQTAQYIAEQAQRFDQTDDITVLTLNRLALA